MATKCSDIMTQNPTCCAPSDSVQEVAQMMLNEDVGAVPVVESSNSKKLIGIITDRDIAINVVAKGDGSSTKVENVMTRDPIACHPQDNINKAMEAMSKHQVRRIPIVDDQDQVVGIIAQADIATRLEHDRKTGDVVEDISEPKK